MRRVARSLVGRNVYHPITVLEIALSSRLPFVIAELIRGYMQETNFVWDCIWHVLDCVNVGDKYEQF